MKKLLSLIVSCALAAAATADEGMWLLTNPPLKAMKEAYGFEPSREWLLHMQRSCVRFETGGSGSLVSADGLVMTNHHVGSDMIGTLSRKERVLLMDGFQARTRAEELRCPDLELRVLQEIEDVTARVNAAASESKNPAEAGVARRRAIADIESESERITGLKSQVVTLYQ
ncbi:MAG: S46 family peptidase, partial [Phycisphaerales bacterium]